MVQLITRKCPFFKAKGKRKEEVSPCLGVDRQVEKQGSAPALVEVKQTICFNFMLRQGLQEVSWNHSPCLSAQQHPATEESSRTMLG